MRHTPTLQVEEMCSILTRTLRGEITWGKELEWAFDEYVDAYGRVGEDPENKKTFILVRKYTNKVTNSIYNFWPVLFVINRQEVSPDEWIIALCNDTKTPVGSVRYDGRENKVFNKVLEAIQLVAE